MTTEELKEGLKRVVSLEFGERYHILVADHKLGNIQPASFFVDEYEKKLLELYRKRYRPNGPRNKLFLTFGSGAEHLGVRPLDTFMWEWQFRLGEQCQISSVGAW